MQVDTNKPQTEVTSSLVPCTANAVAAFLRRNVTPPVDWDINEVTNAIPGLPPGGSFRFYLANFTYGDVSLRALMKITHDVNGAEALIWETGERVDDILEPQLAQLPTRPWRTGAGDGGRQRMQGAMGSAREVDDDLTEKVKKKLRKWLPGGKK